MCRFDKASRPLNGNRGQRGRGILNRKECYADAMQPYPRRFLIALVFAGIAVQIYNWYLLITDHRFYLKSAFVFPGGIPLLIVVILFPQHYSGPQRTAVKWRIVMVLALALGICLGLFNYSLMNNYKP